MDPENRMLCRVHWNEEPDDSKKSPDEVFSILMGDNVEPKKKFHSKQRASYQKPEYLSQKTYILK